MSRTRFERPLFCWLGLSNERDDWPGCCCCCRCCCCLLVLFVVVLVLVVVSRSHLRRCFVHVVGWSAVGWFWLVGCMGWLVGWLVADVVLLGACLGCCWVRWRLAGLALWMVGWWFIQFNGLSTQKPRFEVGWCHRLQSLLFFVAFLVPLCCVVAFVLFVGVEPQSRTELFFSQPTTPTLPPCRNNPRSPVASTGSAGPR